MPSGTPKDIRKQVKEVDKGGEFVFGAIQNIDNIPVENLLALITSFAEEGRGFTSTISPLWLCEALKGHLPFTFCLRRHRSGVKSIFKNDLASALRRIDYSLLTCIRWPSSKVAPYGATGLSLATQSRK